jgi:predicted nuclease with TOPRIM domain
VLKPTIEHRLEALKTEFEAGQQLLAELEAKQANVRETLLRISGAIQVLEELLTEDESGLEHSNGAMSDLQPVASDPDGRGPLHNVPTQNP